MPTEPRYWFPAKRYGWGWGPPLRWQGWTVLVLYTAAIAGIVLRFMPDRHPVAFLAWTAIATVVLIGICWFTGEPPRWRWGRDD